MTRKLTLKKLIFLYAAAAIILLVSTCTAALCLEPMRATVRVSNGTLYDYVVIGENPKATDGYDNAYDTISPGNLNADMGASYISAVVVHPDWEPAKRELRGDIRSLAKRQEWRVVISTSLPAGAPLNVELQPDRLLLPERATLTIRGGNGKITDLRTSNFTFSAPATGIKTELVIIAEQP